MKNYAALIMSTALLIGMGVGFSSCKEDEPPVPPKLSFVESAMTVGEDAGSIEIALALDKPYGKDLNVEFSLGGTASDQQDVGSADADYQVVGDHDVVTIPSGETSVTIELMILMDDEEEDDEQIEILIVDANTSDVEISADDEFVVTITDIAPPVKPVLSFTGTSLTVDEAAGVVDVELTLDKPYGEDLIIEYALAGTAIDQANVGTANADYQVAGDHGSAVIASGQTSGVIQIEILNDIILEEDETIEISIVGLSTSDVEVAAENQAVITVTNDDPKLVASFVNTTMTVNEADGADGLLEVSVQLDVAAPIDITVQYTVENSTAIDSLLAATLEPDPIPPQYYDFYVNSESHELTIPAGETSANIEIQVLSDFMFEEDETIEITLTESSTVAIGTNGTMKITVTQEDGKAIALLWDPTYTDVDMDMFLWFGADVDNLNGLLALAINPDTERQEEIIFFPTAISAGITDLAFGLSYVYYEGTEDPMNFEVHFADFASGVLEPEADRDIYAASYTLANINPWFESNVDPVVVQTFKIVNGAYTDFSDITVPASGSRMKTQQLPEGLQRTKMRPSARLPL